MVSRVPRRACYVLEADLTEIFAYKMAERAKICFERHTAKRNIGLFVGNADLHFLFSVLNGTIAQCDVPYYFVDTLSNFVFPFLFVYIDFVYFRFIAFLFPYPTA